MTNQDMTPAQVSPKTAIASKLDEYKPVIRRLLANSPVTEDQFVAWVANACRASRNGDLWMCDPETVLGAALRCAQLELPPNDGNNLAWIIPYNRRAQFQLGYGGVLELARRAVPGLRFDGRPVYENDQFSLDYGRTPPLKHTPHFARSGRYRTAERGGDGRPMFYYVRAIFPDGTEQVHALDRHGVEYHRSFSKTRGNDDMWNTAYDAAALKSVVLDMRRWLPQTRQMSAAVAADGAVIDVRQMDPELPELATPPEQYGAGPIDDDTVAEPDPDDVWRAEAGAVE